MGEDAGGRFPHILPLMTPLFLNLISWDSESGVMYVEDWPPILYGNFAIALKEGNLFKAC